MSETLVKGAIEVANKWGIFAAIVVFFIWRGDVREQVMSERIAETDQFVRTTLTEALNKTTAALTQNNAILQKLNVNVESNNQFHLEASNPPAQSN